MYCMAKRAQRRQQRAQRLLDPLVEHLERSGANDDAHAFLTALQQWLAKNLHAFTQEERRADGLDEYAAMELGDLPTMYADFDPVVELSQLRTIPPSSIGELGMSLGTTFREGITVWSNRVCPQCQSGLRVMQEEGNPEHLGYECDVCTWIEDEDGTEWPEDAARLVPATTEVLRRRGLLLRSV